VSLQGWGGGVNCHLADRCREEKGTTACYQMGGLRASTTRQTPAGNYLKCFLKKQIKALIPDQQAWRKAVKIRIILEKMTNLLRLKCGPTGHKTRNGSLTKQCS